MLANKHLNTKYIADEIAEAMSANLRFEVREIRVNIRRDYGYLKAWRAKHLALVKLFGEWDQSFEKLSHLMQALVDSSSETFVKWDRTSLDNGASQVNRVFCAFAEPIYAFKHYRPVLSMDGTHMYGK
ncbi:hypothetical protein QQ045_011697 [Rhodiola kirilowii]